MLGLLCLIFGVYWHHHPFTVQIGDSAELISRAYLLDVTHPPGFPLFILLMHFVVSHVSPLLVFSAASVLNIVFSVSLLALLFFSSDNLFLAVGLILALAFSRIYWIYTEIPEVFLLNALFAALLCFLALREERHPTKWGTPLLCFLFCLGFANHPTLVFLFPLVFFACWRAHFGAKIFLATIFGLFCFAALYAGLLLFHPQDLYSWGNLHSLQDVLDHFLRKEYGTFSLTASGEEYYAFKTMAAYGKELLSDLPYGVLLSLVGFYFVWKKKVSGVSLAILVSFLFYVFCFFSLTNLNPAFYGFETLKRFFILPLVLLCFYAVSLLPLLKNWDRRILLLFGLLGLLSFVANLVRYWPMNDYSKNTIVEDYAKNLLTVTSEKEPGVYIIDDEVELFAMQYLQAVFHLRPNIFLLGRYLLASDWHIERLQRSFPHFIMDRNKINKGNMGDIVEDLILPNQPIVFYTLRSYSDPQKTKITYLAAGRRIDPGKGLFFDDASVSALQFRFPISVVHTPLAEYDLARASYAQYAYYYLGKGIVAYKEKDFAAARASFRSALTLVPYCIPCLLNYCKVLEPNTKEPACSDEGLHHFAESVPNYYN